jgi:DNA-binding LacI/PurR family transcriptional regulator
MAAPLPGADSPALPSGLSLVVVAVAGTGADSAAAMAGGLAAVQSSADAHGASVSVLTGDQSSDVDGLYRQALAAAPDAIVVLGPESDDALDRAAASSLAQQFVVLGGQLPEPTTNVTSVVWNGADAQAAEIAAPGGEEAAPPVADLAARAPLALEVGLRAILADRTGVVYTLS